MLVVGPFLWKFVRNKNRANLASTTLRTADIGSCLQLTNNLLKTRRLLPSVARSGAMLAELVYQPDQNFEDGQSCPSLVETAILHKFCGWKSGLKSVVCSGPPASHIACGQALIPAEAAAR